MTIEQTKRYARARLHGVATDLAMAYAMDKNTVLLEDDIKHIIKLTLDASGHYLLPSFFATTFPNDK